LPHAARSRGGSHRGFMSDSSIVPAANDSLAASLIPASLIAVGNQSRRRHLMSRLIQEFAVAPFHLTQAAGLGIGADRLERACAAGALARVGRGWYAVANPVAPWLARLLVLQAENPGLVACGATAALLWSIAVPPFRASPPGELEVAFLEGSGGLRGRRSGVRARRWPIPPHHAVFGPHRVLVTDPFRTGIDLARGQSLPFALVPLDSAARHAVTGGMRPREVVSEFRARLDLMRGAHGVRITASALRHVSPLAESALESIVRGRIIEAGLPSPALQVPLVGESGRSYRADLGLDLPGEPEGSFGLLVEADGLGKYDRVEALAEEKKRQHDLERRGHVFVRAIYGEALSRPEEFLSPMRRILSR
jgi:hypothetical protein